MAAAMLASSRCLSRSLSGLTTKGLQVSKSKPALPAQCKHTSSTAKQSQGSLKYLQPTTRLGSRSVYQGSRKVAPLHLRTIHTSSILCNDVQIVNTPPFADSVSEGDVRWIKAVGDYVEADELVGEIETDKTALAVNAPQAGIIEELLVEDGAKVVANTQLFKLKITGDAPPPAAAAAPEAAAPPPAAAAPPPPPPPAAAPAAGAGPIPTSMPPVPPPPQAPMAAKPTAAVKPAKAPAAGPTITGARTESRVKMNRMRQRIAQRLKDAQNTCAMLTTFNEIDMTNIMELRKKYKDAFLKSHGIKLGFMSAFIKASSEALLDQPVVNAVIDDKEIVYRDYVDISVAVATDKGLVVPVLRNCEGMNYAHVEQGLVELGEKARTGQLAVEDMDGGTFTISNGGVFGSLMGTPIINPPQSAILGMHGIFDRPVAIGGKVEIRPMMYVALTYDHRLVDGREAVTFLRKIKSGVEDPATILMGL